MAAGYCYCLGIKSNNFFLKDNKKAFILWLIVPKVTAYIHIKYVLRLGIKSIVSRRSHPAQSGEDRFGPPTLERSGSEHRVGRFPSSRLRFLSPANGGTEGGVKTIEEDREERWSLP